MSKVTKVNVLGEDQFPKMLRAFQDAGAI